jgi:hypothetical protein
MVVVLDVDNMPIGRTDMVPSLLHHTPVTFLMYHHEVSHHSPLSKLILKVTEEGTLRLQVKTQIDLNIIHL